MPGAAGLSGSAGTGVAGAGRIHVAAAAVIDDQGRVLIARRAAHVHQGGLWEFPGGKLEPGESVTEALARELREELGIVPLRVQPLLRIPYDYPDKLVLLDVWRVDRFRGTPVAREGQPLQWLAPEALRAVAFPPANRPIVTALLLPRLLLVTPQPARSTREFLGALEHSVARHALQMVQLRAPSLEPGAYEELARATLALCRRLDVRLMLNAAPELLSRVPADGVHLSGERLRRCTQRPVPDEVLLSAAVHDGDELARARAVRCDFLLISPVRETATHPRARALGWDGFAALAGRAGCPAYALGGLNAADLPEAMRNGAQGVSAVRALWQA